MPPILVYLLRLSISLAVVWLFYQILLRRLTFYALNRWYLLGYSVLAFFIPLINIYPILGDGGAAGEPYLIQFIPVVGGQGRVVAVETHEGMGWGTWLIWAFALGAVALLVRTVIRGLSLYRLRKSARLIESGPLRIYQVDASIIPFSFGNSIYINQDLHTKQQWSDIILHEYVHIRQKHTMDILVVELMCMLNWYNPFCWLIRWSIRQNLEFIADQQVLGSGVDRKGYQYHLLTVLGESRYRLANNFNFSSLKKRIVMMNKIRSARLHLLKFLFVLPLAVVLLVAFRDKRVVRPVVTMGPDVRMGPQVTTGPAMTIRPGGVVEAGHAEAAGTYSNVMRAGDKTTTGVKVTGGTVRADGGVSQGEVIGAGDMGNRRMDTVPKAMVWDSIRADVLYVVNGEKMPRGWNSNEISPDKILSVVVVKGEEAVRLFGKRGANGVVAITLKDYELHLELRDTVSLSDKNGDYKPLFIVDGQEVTNAIMTALNPNRIESITVHKGDEVARKYGDKGKNGVIMITLKKEVTIFATHDGQVAATMNTKDGPMTIIGDTLRINKP